MNIENIMTKTIIAKDLNTPIWEVSRIMDEYNIGFIPISNNNKIVGVITDRDICIHCCKENSNLQKPINDFITKEIITIDKNENVAETLRILSKYKIKRLLVTDNNQVIGVLSLSDIINHYSELSELLPTLQAIWSIEKTNHESDVKVDSYEL